MPPRLLPLHLPMMQSLCQTSLALPWCWWRSPTPIIRTTARQTGLLQPCPWSLGMQTWSPIQCPEVEGFSPKGMDGGLSYVPATRGIRTVTQIMEMWEQGLPSHMSAVAAGAARIPFRDLDTALGGKWYSTAEKDRMNCRSIQVSLIETSSSLLLSTLARCWCLQLNHQSIALLQQQLMFFTTH